MRSLPGTLDSSSFEALPQLNKTQPVHNRIASFFVVSQCCKPPGLKSDILGGNYLPKAATSRFIAYLVQSLLYYNTISFCVLQAFFLHQNRVSIHPPVLEILCGWICAYLTKHCLFFPISGQAYAPFSSNLSIFLLILLYFGPKNGKVFLSHSGFLPSFPNRTDCT